MCGGGERVVQINMTVDELSLLGGILQFWAGTTDPHWRAVWQALANKTTAQFDDARHQ